MSILKSKNSGIRRAKVVLLGAPSVGKTSLVQRFVHSVFSETQKTTLGVKVDRKTVTVNEREVSLLIWDMHGETEGLDVPANYLTGAAAGLMVVDQTRPDTADVALGLAERLTEASPDAKIFFIANKSDLEADSQLLATKLSAHTVVKTSAKSGEGVEALFSEVAAKLD